MKTLFRYCSCLLLLIIAWEIVGGRYPTVRLFVSTPTHVADFLKESHNDLLFATYRTFTESLLGFTAATACAFVTMTMCIIAPAILRLVLPAMIIFQVIPLITVAPLLIIVMGPGIGPVVVMSTLLSYFPIFVSFAKGVRQIDPAILEYLTLNRASLWDKLRLAYYPLSLPQIFAGLRVGATLSVIGAIVAEFSGIPVGLGRNLYVSALRIEPELMVSTLAMSSLLGGALYGLVSLVERRFAYWYTPGLGV
jgi:NitT/TauT family transport system permease protein